MSKKARVFVPLTKVDEEQRLVYGRITQEILDKSGEVMDYETSKPNFQKWSSEFEEKTGGLSKGNLRVMHGLNVAGKLTDIAFDDGEKAIDVCAKVVDDGEWEKVLEGCYTGFSVGGRYGKKWPDTLSDGTTVQKYTAVPGEVSLVDDPCVPVATFALVKANGETEDKMFKVAAPAEDPATEVEDPAAKAVEEVEEQGELDFTNEQVVEKAAQIATEKNDGSTWMDHVPAARDELTKAAAAKKGKKDDSASAKKEGDEEGKGTAEAETDADEDDSKATKITPPGVKQVWTASDGKTFEKKADAEAHEATLQKIDEPKTEAQLLEDRLNKALTPEAAPASGPDLWEDFDRLSKVVAVISTPFDPDNLAKGMYTVSRFANVLADIGGLTRSIARESTDEGGDSDDEKVSDAMKTSLAALGENFLTYARDEITELLAGIDDEVVVGYYDYYYNVAHTNGEDQLAKDVCATINELRDPSREKRDVLAKAFGFDYEEDDEVLDKKNYSADERKEMAKNGEAKSDGSYPIKTAQDVSNAVKDYNRSGGSASDKDHIIKRAKAIGATDKLPADWSGSTKKVAGADLDLQKRLTEVEADRDSFKKIAETAVEKVEELAKRVTAIEDTPLPRAPSGHLALRDGDLGKTNTQEEQMAQLHNLLKTYTPDQLSLMMIKAAHQGGGQKLTAGV